MQQSTNYQLNLVEGTDLVNPLTIDKPNYQKIDEVMKTNANNSISMATATKSGTTHAITCSNAQAVFFRFTATSDYAEGDGFTFNTTPVQASLPDGSALPAGVFKINSTVLASVVGTKLTIYANGISQDEDIHAADSDKLGGQLPSYYAKAVDAFGNYTEQKTGNTHALTGGNGNNIRFVATSDFTSGDIITVNGTSCTAQYVDGEALETGAWKSGAVVTCYRNGNVLNFNRGAGLSASDKANLVPSNIRENVTIAGVTGNLKPLVTNNSGIVFLRFKAVNRRSSTNVSNNLYNSNFISYDSENDSFTFKIPATNVQFYIYLGCAGWGDRENERGHSSCSITKNGTSLFNETYEGANNDWNNVYRYASTSVVAGDTIKITPTTYNASYSCVCVRI